MKSEEEILFKELAAIQNEAIAVALIRQDKYKDLEEILTDISYEVLFRCMELFDGHYNSDLKYGLVNLKSNAEVNRNGDLHDICPDYLKYTNR